MIDDTLLPGQVRRRRTGDGAPTLRTAVDAFIDGTPIAWDAAIVRGRTHIEQRMMGQVRALAVLSAEHATAPRQVLPCAARPGVLEWGLDVIAIVQVTTALPSGLVTSVSAALPTAQLGAMLTTSLVALVLIVRGRKAPAVRLLGHALLLVAAWQARPFLDAVAASGAPLWLRAWWQAVFVHAFLPVAVWRLAHEYPPPVRFSWSERVSSMALEAALACSLCLAAACALPVLIAGGSDAVDGPHLIAVVSLGWAVLAACTVAARTRRLARPAPSHGTAPTRRTWRSRWRARAASVSTCLRGTSATALAALAADMQRARSPREVGAALVGHVGHAVGPTWVAVVVPGTDTWPVVAGVLPELSADSATVSMLAAADEPIRVDAYASIYRLLPDADRDWLAAADVATMVRLATQDGTTLAGLLVGAGPDGRPHTRRDRAFIAAAARTAAVALSSLTRRPEVAAGVSGDDDLSFECGTCGAVSAGADACACGGMRHLAALPTSLRGAFRVERRIGRGGMGIVYLGRDLRLDRPVALKTLPSLSSSCVTTLRAEARAMAAVEHPSVAVIYGLEEWRGTPVLVVEYLPGGTLAARLAAGPMAVADALPIGVALAEALDALHARGWLHRDIKPSNIGFCRTGVPKLLDFGLTRWTHDAPEATASTPLSGTPLYLSPELIDGEPAGEHDDVWALALIVVEMITGVHPFHGVSVEEVLRRVRHHGPMDVRRWAAMMPPALVDVLARALHPARSQRLTTARRLAAALRTVAVVS